MADRGVEDEKSGVKTGSCGMSVAALANLDPCALQIVPPDKSTDHRDLETIKHGYVSGGGIGRIIVLIKEVPEIDTTIPSGVGQSPISHSRISVLRPPQSYQAQNHDGLITAPKDDGKNLGPIN
ncbi:hypothetical protein Ancab_031823 [Ancistrocladus abbreviatus]